MSAWNPATTQDLEAWAAKHDWLLLTEDAKNVAQAVHKTYLTSNGSMVYVLAQKDKILRIETLTQWEGRGGD